MRTMTHDPRILALAFLGLTAWTGLAAADGIKIELNKLEPQAASCRVYMLFENSGPAIEALALDLVLFDPSEVISRRVTVDSGPLRASKTTLKLFDIPDLACTDIRRILVNEVSDCRDAKGSHQDCIERLTLASRSDVELVK
jgi:hypothetical protein